MLASGSPRRLALLAQIGVEPDAVIPADIEETPRRNESPRALAQRLAAEKATIAAAMARKRPDLGPSLTLAADTVVCVGRRILPKCEILDEAEDCLQPALRPRASRLHRADADRRRAAAQRHRLVETRVRFKRLSRAEIAAYLASGEWRGKAGGYAIQGLAGAFVLRLVGSYTSVVGLPLAETAALLAGEGYLAHRGWTPGA